MGSMKKRVLTAKRREQNRVAQQKFREKRRIRKISEETPESSHVSGNDYGEATHFQSWHSAGGVQPNFSSGSVETGMIHAFREPPSQARAEIPNMSSVLADSSLEDEIDEFSRAVLQDDSSIVEALTYACDERKAPTAEPPVIQLPDIYSNHIRIHRISLYTACHENARLLGVPKSLARKQEYKSPFYEPHCTSELGMIARQQSFDFLIKDLRPSLVQITHEHPFYIDVFPFTIFRDRVVNFLSMSPPGFDEDELKNDLNSEGIICWGNLGRSGTGTPWDQRSWEAQPWFLRKWWMLTRDSELDDQSRWWRNMRGEGDAYL